MVAPELPEGTVIGDAYRVVRPLSSGGMGAVYVAEQLATGRQRALKLMHHRLQADPKLRERFVKEARLAASIDSAHVVEVIGAGVEADSGTPWLAMELLEGEDLADHVGRSGPLSASRVLELHEQIGHALGEAHDARIVHRDLKPENIFIAQSKTAGQATTVKVLDFGIAKLVADAQTLGTAAVGSPAWMAPEQAEGAGKITPATDVWALGLLTFWMLTGGSYWRTAKQDNPSMHAFLKEVLFDALPAASKRATELECPERLPAGFDDWFDRCVHREPRARFRSARELLEALRAVLAGVETEESTGAAPSATEDAAPLSTRAFISSGELGQVDLPDEAPASEPPSDEADPAAEQDAEEPPEPSEHSGDDEAEQAAEEQPPAPTPAPTGDTVDAGASAATEPAPAPRRSLGLAAVAVVAVVAGLGWWFYSSRTTDVAPDADSSAEDRTGAQPSSTDEESSDQSETATSGESEGAGSEDGSSAADTGERGEPSVADDGTALSKAGATQAQPSATASSSPSASSDAGPQYPPFNRFFAKNRVNQRARLTESRCSGRGDPQALAVTLTFSGDGSCEAVGMDRRVRHTPVGMCVNQGMRVVRVPPFSGPGETMNVTLSLK